MQDRRETQGWKLDELAEEAGVSPRTVRYYVQRGLLPAPPFRGRDTVYGPEHLVRLRAVKRLQEKFLPLDRIEVELASRSLAEIERLAAGEEPGPVGEVVPRAPPVPESRPIPPISPHLPPPGRTGTMHERWRRIRLGPGLELNVDESADPATQQLAQRIEEWVRLGRGPFGSTR